MKNGFARMLSIPRPDSEIARIRATRAGAAVAKVPVQVDALLYGPIKVERCLTGRLLHCKREVALRIDGSVQRIGSLGRRCDRKRSAQDATPLALDYPHR